MSESLPNAESGPLDFAAIRERAEAWSPDANGINESVMAADVVALLDHVEYLNMRLDSLHAFADAAEQMGRNLRSALTPRPTPPESTHP